MHPLMKKIFEARGITPELWENMNDATHKPLAHIDELCEKLKQVRDEGKSIVVLPDFDMDGIMSGTIGYAGLSALGFDVDLFIPNPKAGYGFGSAQIQDIIAKFPYADVIITCDTGIGCVEGVATAKQEGLDVFITDHHVEKKNTDDKMCSPRGIADVIVNPCCIDETYEHPAICGAHVLWQVLDRFAHLYGDETDIERISFLRVFAGIGTISDTMPVLWENRALVCDSVEICKKIWLTHPDFLHAVKDAPDNYVNAFRGIYAVLNMFSGAGKLRDPKDINESFFGFYLAPAFNSVKRMDGEMLKAFNVFLGVTPSDNVNYLLDLNEKRKDTVDKSLKELMEQENELAPIMYVSDAIPGVLGLLATKLLQANNFPTLVVRENDNGSFKGSGRAPEWFSISELAPEFEHCLAGHQGAFGCRFADEEEMLAFVDVVGSAAKEKAKQIEEEQGAVKPFDIVVGDMCEDIDAELVHDDLLDFTQELESYRPFGRGFEEPIVLVSFRAGDARWVPIGSKDEHLKIRIPTVDDKVFDVLCWGHADVIDNVSDDDIVHVMGTLSINEFRGECSVQMQTNNEPEILGRA